MVEAASQGAGGRVVVISGTGTGIGKTHFSEALLLALAARGLATVGLKPIETGLGREVASDAARLGAASSFHVKRSPYTFAAPLSPHLAARDANAPPIRPDTVVQFVAAARRDVDIALVELPGGLFTPLTDAIVNADLVQALAPDATFLVAPDRLGVLHDVLAAVRAAGTLPIHLDGIVLVMPPVSDPSTGRNATELQRLLPRSLVATLGRKTVRELATDPALEPIVARVTTRVAG